MIRKLLIANRGEIARRIIRSARSLGIATVAVYSEADRDAAFVGDADQAVLLGGSEARESYLAADKIIAAAQRCGADAIHPGYGFLAENAGFAQACNDAGITFVGPAPDHIAAMGSKIEAKKLAEDLGIPTVPGYHGGETDGDKLASQAEAVGYPLMIKASAGGGGKGMRIVYQPAEFADTLNIVQTESGAAFGDSRVLLERYIATPRHIEVQIAGDQHGNHIHLFERECSIQRHYQKVIEEAPAANLTDDQRTAIYDHALTLARHIGYSSLGTVEFILDDDSGNVYFLEMNTRLQVEHPVTEMITGLDLVAMQIGIAQGSPLPLSQDAVTQQGWAIEARINAENPANNFLPELGTVATYIEPASEAAGDDIRIDSGIREGSVVGPHYDSMLAKIIGRGADRETARQNLLLALQQFTIAGVETNLPFLHDLVAAPQFANNVLNTHFIADLFPEGWQERLVESGGDFHVAAVAAITNLETAAPEAGAPEAGALAPFHALGAWRITEPAGFAGGSRFAMRRQDGEVAVLRITGRDGDYVIEQDDQKISLLVVNHDDREFLIETDGLMQHWHATSIGYQTNDWLISGAEGAPSRITIFDDSADDEDSAGASGSDIVAPLPGVVNEILVAVGDVVKSGDMIVVMEAMKMIHKLAAGTAGAVTEIRCQAGETVPGDVVLVTIEPSEES